MAVIYFEAPKFSKKIAFLFCNRVCVILTGLEQATLELTDTLLLLPPRVWD